MKRKSDARAQGTNPRFPWKPSAAMLTFRLTGTTGAIGVDRGEHQQSRPDAHGTATNAESSLPMERSAPRC